MTPVTCLGGNASAAATTASVRRGWYRGRRQSDSARSLRGQVRASHRRARALCRGPRRLEQSLARLGRRHARLNISSGYCDSCAVTWCGSPTGLDSLEPRCRRKIENAIIAPDREELGLPVLQRPAPEVRRHHVLGPADGGLTVLGALGVEDHDTGQGLRQPGQYEDRSHHQQQRVREDHLRQPTTLRPLGGIRFARIARPSGLCRFRDPRLPASWTPAIPAARARWSPR